MVALTQVSIAEDDIAPKVGFSNNSELGIVITGGNARSETLSFAQDNSYRWATHFFRLKGRYLNTEASGNLSARFWHLGLRFEETFSQTLGGFIGQEIESNIFTGFLQRYNTDLGLQMIVLRKQNTSLQFEGGFRHIMENYITGTQNQLATVRLFTEVEQKFAEKFKGTLWLELLPNIANLNDFRANTEASVTSSITDIWSLKVSYLVKYLNQLIPGQVVQTDTVFTTSIVASF